MDRNARLEIAKALRAAAHSLSAARPIKIDKKAVARQNIKLAYDRESGFFGSSVKGKHFPLTVSEYDLILGIAADGTYRIMTTPEKVLFSARLLHCEVFDPDQGFEFTLVYRDKAKIAWGKRVHILKFIRNKEYQLIKDRKGKIDLLLPTDQAGTLAMEFVPAPRQRVKKGRFDLSGLEPTGLSARGIRLAPKPVKAVRHEPPKKQKPARRKKKPPGPIDGEQSSLF